MPAYLLVEVEIHDAAQYENYKKMTPGSLVPFGGRFIVRGGAAETLEGDGRPGRIVVVEFPSMGKARAWWNSPEYEPAKKLRQRIATTRMLLVEGSSPVPA
ncbi:MAG TPA: DUF1330 domain-containing protein [Terriglobales bacterium]|nr:DUF1330 domain-containing protein [Terriglobales bacterium]